jgi:hypothetical protein
MYSRLMLHVVQVSGTRMPVSYTQVFSMTRLIILLYVFSISLYFSDLCALSPLQYSLQYPLLHVTIRHPDRAFRSGLETLTGHED